MSRRAFFSLAAGVLTLIIFVLMVYILRGTNSRTLLGRILDGEDLLRVQVESDYDRDGDVDFLDFTVFSAFYEESV